MCDPLTIAGIALTAGSTVANSVGASKAARARDDALTSERIRQNAYDQEAQALNAQSQDSFQGFDGKQQESASTLGKFFTDQKIEAGNANAAAAAEMAVPASTSNITVQEEANQRGKARAFTDKQGQALGQLRAFGDVLGSLSRSQARNAGQIGIIGNLRGGSSNVLPLELDEASHAGDRARGLGDVLNLGGTFAVNRGLSRGALFPDAPKLPAAAPWSGMRTVTSPANAALLRRQKKYGGLY